MVSEQTMLGNYSCFPPDFFTPNGFAARYEASWKKEIEAPKQWWVSSPPPYRLAPTSPSASSDFTMIVPQPCSYNIDPGLEKFTLQAGSIRTKTDGFGYGSLAVSKQWCTSSPLYPPVSSPFGSASAFPAIDYENNQNNRVVKILDDIGKDLKELGKDFKELQNKIWQKDRPDDEDYYTSQSKGFETSVILVAGETPTIDGVAVKIGCEPDKGGVYVSEKGMKSEDGTTIRGQKKIFETAQKVFDEMPQSPPDGSDYEDSQPSDNDEVRELLPSYEINGDDIRTISGSALLAMETLTDPNEKRDENRWVDKMYELMDSVDSYIPSRQTELSLPLAIEDDAKLESNEDDYDVRLDEKEVKCCREEDVVHIETLLAAEIEFWISLAKKLEENAIEGKEKIEEHHYDLGIVKSVSYQINARKEVAEKKLAALRYEYELEEADNAELHSAEGEAPAHIAVINDHSQLVVVLQNSAKLVNNETIELTEKAVVELNEVGNWRGNLKVRLMLKHQTKELKQGQGAWKEAFDGHMTSGWILYEHQLFKKALVSLKRALELQPTDVRSHFRAGSSLYVLGKGKESKDEFWLALEAAQSSGNQWADFLPLVYVNLGISLEGEELQRNVVGRISNLYQEQSSQSTTKSSNTTFGNISTSKFDGVLIDCWWGIVDRTPQVYNWNGYKNLFQMIRLKVHGVITFNRCGDNVKDDGYMQLPVGVREISQSNSDLYFNECPTWEIDKQLVLRGWTALEVYFDYTQSSQVDIDGIKQLVMMLKLIVYYKASFVFEYERKSKGAMLVFDPGGHTFNNSLLSVRKTTLRIMQPLATLILRRP